MEKREEDIECGECGTTPTSIILWKGVWRCYDCDEKRRRREIEQSGTVVDDDGVSCQGCLFGVRLVDMHVIDPNGDGPFHRNCALANATDPRLVRLAPDEFKIFEKEDFRHRVERKKEN